LITKHNIPSEVLLSSYPRLQKIFAPLFACIKRGDLSGFDDALVAGEAEFVRRRIYLTLERGRDIALRNLFRKVFLVGGFEDLKEGQTEKDRVRKTRIPIANFAAAMKIGMAGDGSGELLENDEVECMLANMIYKVRLQYTLRRIWVVTTGNPHYSPSCSTRIACMVSSKVWGELASSKHHGSALHVPLFQSMFANSAVGPHERLHFKGTRHGGVE
jgi:hypothetical protein